MRFTRALQGTPYHIASFSADKLKCARKALQVAYRVSEQQLLWHITMVAVHKSNGQPFHLHIIHHPLSLAQMSQNDID